MNCYALFVTVQFLWIPFLHHIDYGFCSNVWNVGYLGDITLFGVCSKDGLEKL